ncbi:hypothetical protein TEMA_08500 [Terrisporobacter mayombei]|uniref:Uncharacterized protein n=1 Tax=Terrisporobacter mayombei TaxID=1541 RepID=A0ABY9Q021_9FIRM|nr:hypothetical protein TEMA_08500 [Terrisporobacter mayombei]
MDVKIEKAAMNLSKLIKIESLLKIKRIIE